MSGSGFNPRILDFRCFEAQVSILEFWISVWFVLYISLSKQVGRWKNNLSFEANDLYVNYETFTETRLLIPLFPLLIVSYAKR